MFSSSRLIMNTRRLWNCTVPQMIPNRKWSRDRKWSPKWTANDPRPQVIPKVDRKWSRENLRNGMDLWDWLQKRTDYKKRNLFLLPFKEKGKEDATSQVNSYKAKKKMESIWKGMVLTVYFFLCRLLQFSSKNVSSFEKFNCRTLRRKNSIILTPRSSTFLLRNTKPGTLYITRALLTLLILLKEWN